jgi:hypothetical protein
MPARFDVPDRALWQTGYARAVQRAVEVAAETLDEALSIVARFLDPVLTGTANGHWDPEGSRWSEATES